MPEIKTTYPGSVEQYAIDNNLDILNHMQIAAKFMELEARVSNLENTWSTEDSVTGIYYELNE